VERVETVLGAVAPDELGITLVHEHILVDWIGAEQTSPDRYEADAVVGVVLPYLREVRELGVRTLVDCTPAYLGRDVRVLQRLAEASGLNILTNTGYYGAADDRFVPRSAYERPAEALAEDWIREYGEGIDGTGIRPAFMKIGVDAGPLSAIDAKLVEAAAIAHQATGMAIHAHTSDATAGLAELEILETRQVPLDAFVWVHAQIVDDVDVLAGVAERGAWVELDGVAPDTLVRHAELVMGLVERGHLDRVLISHDAGSYTVGEPGGAAEKFRGYDLISRELVPDLRARGLPEDGVRTLLVDNPRAVLARA
jgi:phosphotriesterase-related protein